MPHETFTIRTANTDETRKHDQVADDISRAFDVIKERGGQFVTAIAMADKSSDSGAGGHPDSALYIVADMPEHQS